MLLASALPLLISTLALPVQNDVRPPQRVLPHFDDTRHAPPALDANRFAVEAPRPTAKLSTSDAASPPLPALASAVEHTLDRVHVDRPNGTDWWARGATYKARFGADGVDYIPFLGSDAPQNYPVSLRLLSAEAGGQPLVLAQDVQAEHTGEAMTFERGPLTERYLLSLESLEQTFVIHDAFAGELSVRIGLDTELAAQEFEGGLAFGNELGSVRLSEAFAVDANGFRAALATSFDGESYEIVVPANVVAAATFPLTIDPIVSTFAIDTFGTSLEYPRAAYDPATATFLVVYNEDFSNNDSDIFSTQISIDGTESFSGYFDISADRWSFPDAGTARTSDAILVAAAVDTGLFTNATIQGRLFTPSAPSYGAAFQIDSGGHPGPMNSVAVGGDPLDRFLVVWNRMYALGDHDIFGRVVLASGTPVGTNNITIDNSTADFRSVQCSKHNGSYDSDSSTWGITMNRYAAQKEVWMARIEWDGALVQAPTLVYAASGGYDSFYPVISSPLEQAGPRTYLITFGRDFGADFDIFAAVVQDGNLHNVTNLSFGGLGGPTGYDSEFYPQVDSNGLSFVMAWQDGPFTNFDTTFVSTINLVAGELCVSENSVIDYSGDLFPYGVIAQSDAPAFDPDYLIVGELDEDIYGTHYAADWNCVGQRYCSPSPNSTGLEGRIYAQGTGVAGDSLVLYANRVPLNKFGYFLVGRTAGAYNPPSSQGTLCLQGNIGRYNGSILNSGSGGHFSLNIDTNQVPLNPATAVLPGETLRFTCWYRDNNPGVTSNFTDGVRITFL